ncbi:rhomboid family intramembrane serine protease [Longibacter salinarum]|uniref:Rhomboid family intramembrane serine protease n=2 Tax=Longibacter salinarum TaxID=1850348 RepID=A0A2A8CYI7_9BACT|nr:rhomboid family intramembrane serine protease [Longibacter salinarum]
MPPAAPPRTDDTQDPTVVNQLQSWYYRQPPALRVILAINVTVYVLAQFLRVLWPGGLAFIVDHFALHATFPDILLEPWQLITYNFMHTSAGFGGLLHIAFNMLWLFWIGREYEEMHGSDRMWTVYILAGIGGGLVSLLLMPLGIFGNPNIPIVGASASVLGVLMAVAILYPYKQIALLFIGVVRLIWVVIGFLVIDVLINLGSNSVALTAHWGGALSGYLFAKAERGGMNLTGWTRIFGGGSKKKRGRRGSKKGESLGLLGRLEVWLGGNPNPDPDSGSTSPVSSRSASSSSGSSKTTTSSKEDEVDRILEKISEQGYDALTEEEKRILYEASQD